VDDTTGILTGIHGFLEPIHVLVIGDTEETRPGVGGGRAALPRVLSPRHKYPDRNPDLTEISLHF
jgi:hypothetical protein